MFLTNPVFAQTPPEDTSRFLPLVTCGVGDAKPCTICDIWVLSDRVVNFAFFLATPILIIVLIVGGFIYLTSGGNPKKTEQAKSLLTSAIVGIIIALAAWLIVSTILKNLAKEGNEFMLPWDKMPTCPIPIAPTEVDLSKLPGPTRPGVQVPTTPTGEFGTEEQARAFFIHGGIEIRSTGNCASQQTSTCTSLIGYPTTSAVKLLSFLQSLEYGVIITGGTEVGHAENGDHGIGKSGIDLKPTSSARARYEDLRDKIKITLGGTARCESSKNSRGQVRIIEDCGEGTSHVHATIPR